MTVHVFTFVLGVVQEERLNFNYVAKIQINRLLPY